MNIKCQWVTTFLCFLVVFFFFGSLWCKSLCPWPWWTMFSFLATLRENLSSRASYIRNKNPTINIKMTVLSFKLNEWDSPCPWWSSWWESWELWWSLSLEWSWCTSRWDVLTDPCYWCDLWLRDLWSLTVDYSVLWLFLIWI